MALGTNLGILAQLQSGLPPFTNTYSLEFDGVDDYVNCGFISGLKQAPAFTISVWLKFDSLSGTQRILGTKDGLSIISLATVGSKFYPAIASAYGVTPTVSLLINTWYNVVWVYDGTLPNVDRMRLYIDGSEIALAITGTIPVLTPTFINSPPFYLGSDGFGTPLSDLYAGGIDEFSIFNTVEPIANLWDGSGDPTDLSLLATPPIHWYRMGDNGAYKSPQWLIPNNENKDKVSNYSYQFEGINSRQMTVGTVNVGTTNTTSIWLKRNVVSTQQTLLGGSSLVFPDYYMLLFTANDFYVRYSPTVVIGWQQALVKAIFNNTTDWINIVVVRNGNTVKLHLNGDDAGIAPNFANGGAIGALDTKFTDIGADTGGINPTNGIINNIATWNVDTVLPSDIYNGGTPPDLTTLSTAPVNWCKMGEDATFVYNVGGNGTFTVPDQVGSNDGTSTTVIEDRVGFAPSSENNALSINMDFVDRVLDTPPTP